MRVLPPESGNRSYSIKGLSRLWQTIRIKIRIFNFAGLLINRFFIHFSFTSLSNLKRGKIVPSVSHGGIKIVRETLLVPSRSWPECDSPAFESIDWKSPYADRNRIAPTLNAMGRSWNSTPTMAKSLSTFALEFSFRSPAHCATKSVAFPCNLSPNWIARWTRNWISAYAMLEIEASPEWDRSMWRECSWQTWIDDAARGQWPTFPSMFPVHLCVLSWKGHLDKCRCVWTNSVVENMAPYTRPLHCNKIHMRFELRGIFVHKTHVNQSDVSTDVGTMSW